MEPVDPPLSPLQVLHASVFSIGLATLMTAAITTNLFWFVVSGPLLSLSGILILAGFGITFRGPVGQILRAALGRETVRRAIARGVVWLVVGVLLSVWGLLSLRERGELAPQHLILERGDAPDRPAKSAR